MLATLPQQRQEKANRHKENGIKHQAKPGCLGPGHKKRNQVELPRAEHRRAHRPHIQYPRGAGHRKNLHHHKSKELPKHPGPAPHLKLLLPATPVHNNLQQQEKREKRGIAGQGLQKKRYHLHITLLKYSSPF